MKQIQWTDSMYTGDQTIDEQHKHLLKLTNDLIDQKDSGLRSGKLCETFNELLNYVRIHFNEEEHHFKGNNNLEEQKHIEEHNYFLEKLLSFHEKMDCNAPDEEIAFEMVSFLRKWIYSHLAVSDMKILQK